MAVVNKFNVNKQEVTLDADIIEDMSANDVSYDDYLQYDENTVGNKLNKFSELEKKISLRKSTDITENTIKTLSDVWVNPTSGKIESKPGFKTRVYNIGANAIISYKITGTPNAIVSFDTEPEIGDSGVVEVTTPSENAEKKSKTHIFVSTIYHMHTKYY